MFDKTVMRIAVTGAFGYSGRYITKRLLEAGHEVITLTNSLNRANSFGQRWLIDSAVLTPAWPGISNWQRPGLRTCVTRPHYSR